MQPIQSDFRVCSIYNCPIVTGVRWLCNIFTITRWSATLRLFYQVRVSYVFLYMEKDLSWKKTTLGGSLKYSFGIWPLLTSGVCQTSVVKVHTIFCLFMCCGTLENMTLRNLPPFAKWTSDTLQTRNLKFKTSRTEFWAYLGKCQFCQSGYVKRFTSGYPLDVQSVTSWYSELKRSVASSSFSVWLCTSAYLPGLQFTSQIFNIAFLILHWFLKLVANLNF